MSESDGRRRSGAETRRRLVEATADALAAGGVSGVSLRSVSAAAGANVAAVKYHFGSREALITNVLAETTGQIFRAQRGALDVLEANADDASARAWVEAWARPLLEVVVSSKREQRRLGHIVGRSLGDQAHLGAEVRALAAETDARFVRGLAGSLDVAEAECWLRLAAMASALAGLASGTFSPLLERGATDAPLDDRLLDLLEAIATAGG